MSICRDMDPSRGRDAFHVRSGRRQQTASTTNLDSPHFIAGRETGATRKPTAPRALFPTHCSTIQVRGRTQGLDLEAHVSECRSDMGLRGRSSVALHV